MAFSASRIATAQTAVPTALQSGVYPLQAYNGKPLPADFSLIPPKIPPGVEPERFRACMHVVTGGSLTLDAEARRFSFTYDVWSPCDRAFLPKGTTSGTFEQHGNDLVFQLTRGNRSETFQGSVGPSSITLYRGQFEFRAR